MHWAIYCHCWEQNNRPNLAAGVLPWMGQETRSAGQQWKACDPRVTTPHKGVKSDICPAHLSQLHVEIHFWMETKV